MQIKNCTCKLKIVLQIENRKHIDANYKMKSPARAV